MKGLGFRVWVRCHSKHCSLPRGSKDPIIGVFGFWGKRYVGDCSGKCMIKLLVACPKGLCAQTVPRGPYILP